MIDNSVIRVILLVQQHNIADNNSDIPISFLGLIIANLSRQLFKTYKHTWLIFGSAVLGMIVLVGGQLVVEHGFSYSIPISVLITIGGGLYFLILLFGKGRQRIC